MNGTNKITYLPTVPSFCVNHSTILQFKQETASVITDVDKRIYDQVNSREDIFSPVFHAECFEFRLILNKVGWEWPQLT